MACTGSGVQIPSAPLTSMNLKYIREIFNQTKDLIGSQSLIAVISIIQVSFVVNQLGPENYGAAVLLIAVPSLIFRATHARNSDAHLLTIKMGNSLFFESILFNGLTGLFSLLICLFIFNNQIIINSSIGTYFGLEILSFTLVIYLFSRVIHTFSETAKAILIFNNQMRKYSILELGSVSVRFIALIILLLDEPTVENFLIAQSIYGVFYGFFGIYLCVKDLKITKLKKRDFLKYITGVKSEYKKIRYDQIIGLIPQHFDVIILAIVLDLQTVGIYQFAKRLVEPINYLVVTFNPWLQNKLKIQDKNFKIRSFFFQILVPLSVVLIAAYNLIGKNIILLIGNEEFLDSYNPMLILLVGFITYLLTFWIRQYLLFYGLIHFHAYGRIIYSITFVLLALLLSESYSSLGIAYSLSAAMVVQKLFEIIIFKTKITKFI